MTTAVKIIQIVGSIITIIGISWALTGAFDYFAGRKNGNPAQQDQGFTSIISGVGLGAVAGGATAAIVAALNSLAW